MPFYEYQCSACGHHHEELQKITDRRLRKCPDCGRNTLRRLVSAPVFRLKGGGWYETDFKADHDNKRNLARDQEPAAETPKEAKPDATAKDAAPKADETAAALPAAKPKETPAKPAPARKTTTRRRPHK